MQSLPFVLLLTSAALAHAQLPVARLTSIFPPGGPIGSTVEVSVAGIDLDDATHLGFSHSKITASAAGSDKFLVSIHSNVPPGLYDARVIGRHGISNPRRFVVSDLPEMNESGANSDLSKPLEVPVGTVINGRTDSEAADYFRFTAKSGQRILIECVAAALDSRADPVMVLFDSAGREMTRSRRGGLLDFHGTNDLALTLKLHDLVYRGGPDYHYRLSISTRPHIDLVFPPAAVPGTTNKHVLYGRNLPGSELTKDLHVEGNPLDKLAVEILAPSETEQLRPGTAVLPALLEGFDYRLEGVGTTSNPFRMGFATAPPLAESEPNDEPEHAQKLSLPCEISGQFYPANDRDWFTFEAKKGEAYWIDVLSERLDCPSDPFVLVQRVTSNAAADLQEVDQPDIVSAGNELKFGTRDPAWRFEAKEDGTYRVQVRDLFSRLHSDFRNLYRLSIRKPAPDFQLVAFPETPPPPKEDAKDVPVWQTFLRRGESAPLRIVAFRRDGFNGEIKVSAEELPTGLNAADTRIESGKTSALLLLTAGADAPGWIGPLKIMGRGEAEGRQLKRVAQGGTLVHPIEDKTKEPFVRRITDQLSIAISAHEPAPLAIRAAEDKVWEAAPEAKLNVPLRIVRGEGFNEPFKLKAAGISAVESLKEFEVAEKATNAILELDLAKSKLAPGEHSFFLYGQAKGKYRKNPEAVAAAERQVKAAETAVAEIGGGIKKAEAGLAALTAESRPAAEKALADLKTQLKEAEEKKSSAAALLKEASERAKPREVSFTVYSEPIRVRVTQEKVAKVAGADQR